MMSQLATMCVAKTNAAKLLQRDFGQGHAMLTEIHKDVSSNNTSENALSDEQLFARFRESGDREVFSMLVKRYEREVFGYLKRYLGDQQLAEDVFQATFITVYRKAEQFEAGRAFRPWLYTIATNKAIDAQRAKKRSRLRSLDADLSHSGNSSQSNGRPSSMLEQLVDVSADVQGESARSETRQEVRDAMEELNDISKQVIHLVYFQGMKYSEAAETLDIPIGTVRSRLHMAIRKLQEIWQRKGRK
jgi:RNA polymerase sigma-70 factor (ECF subfamily)